MGTSSHSARSRKDKRHFLDRHFFHTTLRVLLTRAPEGSFFWPNPYKPCKVQPLKVPSNSIKLIRLLELDYFHVGYWNLVIRILKCYTLPYVLIPCSFTLISQPFPDQSHLIGQRERCHEHLVRRIFDIVFKTVLLCLFFFVVFFASLVTAQVLRSDLVQADRPDAILSQSQVFKAQDYSVTLMPHVPDPEVRIHWRVNDATWLEDGIVTQARMYIAKTEIRSGLWIQYEPFSKSLLVWTAYYGPEFPMRQGIPTIIK